ncbi:MAG TPA: PspA/IM30 family protein [Clostridiales bacterium]|nr:PspA/IM30 family protein [Clostridiales bacterium]
MGILVRFKEIMSSNINAMLDKAEDPGKMIDQTLRNLNSDLGNVKSETATVMAEEKRAKRAVDECKKEVDKMQSYAVKALESNNEADARKFLEEKSTLTSKLTTLEQTHQIALTNAEKMREMHDKLVIDISELQSRKDVIKGKLSVAKAQEKMNKMVSSSVTDANSSMASFERYEDMANAALDKANAMADLNQSGEDNAMDDLMGKYDSDSTSVDVDNELEALKASLNKE